MIRALMVNQRRFFNSVALAKAPKFKFDANCSAADAIEKLSI